VQSSLRCQAFSFIFVVLDAVDVDNTFVTLTFVTMANAMRVDTILVLQLNVLAVDSCENALFLG
jgi:hypothetical protein